MKNNSLKEYTVSFLYRYKIYLISLISIAICAAIFSISVNYKIKEIIDAIASDKNANLAWLLGLFVFYKFMLHGVFFLSRLLNIKYFPEIIEETTTYIYKKTVTHSLHWFDSHLSGEISSKISDFQSSITALITNSFTAFYNISVVLVSLFFLYQVNIFSTAVVMVFVLVYAPVIYFLVKKQISILEVSINAKQKTIGIINDSITNIFGIKIVGDVLSEFKFKLKPAINNWKKLNKKSLKFDALFVDNADTIMMTILSAVQIYLLAYLYQKGSITSGGFAFIAMVTLNIHNELHRLLDSLLFHINPSIAQLKSSYSFINKPLDIEDGDQILDINNVTGIIQYMDVSFSYGKGEKQVLNNFTLDIKSGEKLGIVGASGAGKTTLIKCLLRYFDVNSGAVTVDGKNIVELTQESLRKAISIIPQDISMFHSSIRENLKLAKYDATDEEMILASKKAKIHDDILAMRDGYDSIIGERGVKLSGGQRQRIAIARAILKNAPILILDEATSSLDTPTEKLIQDSINQVLETSKATVIAIAHRLSTLKHMDRIIVLDEGKIVEEGRHDLLIQKKDGFYKRLWDMQVI